MAGYIGSKVAIASSDGFNKVASDTRFVNATGDTMSGDLTVPNVTVTGTVDGRDVALDGAKLDSLATVATTGSFNDLSDQPAPFDPTTLATVATTGSFNDLSDQPAPFDPTTLATVATTGSFNDLSDKPTADITGVTAGSGLTGGGTSGSVTVSHADTSSQGSVNNSDNTVIQDITLDTYGHVTGLGSATLTAASIGALSTSGKAADSNLLDGLDLHTGRNNSANKVVRTNSSGYCDFGWINTTSGDTGSSLSRVYVDTGDGYIRKCTLAHLKNQLGIGPVSSGLLTISSDYQVHTWNHGLGYTPLSFGAYLQCITAYGTFQVGDRMMIATTMDDDGATQSVWASSTQVGVSFRSMGYTTQPRNSTGQYMRDIRSYFKVGLWAQP